MNDWEIIPFLKVVFVIHLVFLALISLDIFGFSIPIIRQIISFLYIAYIPGILILRILRLHNLGQIETLLYSVGLSITVLMFTGFGINMISPFFEIQEPFSSIPMAITISGIVLILSGICYVRDKDHAIQHTINIDREDYLPIFFLSLIPCISVLGAYLMNVQYNNTLLMFMLVVIALVALLVGFDRFIPAKFYPLAIFVLALSLLFHKSLISMNLWGWDIFHEYYLASQVIQNSFWDSTRYSNVNAMLSIVSLIPFYSSICAMSPVWVLKIIYPFIFSFVPLGLYKAIQKQTNDKIAFFSMFFFISIFTFYSEMLALARQQMAELFLVLTILVMVDKTMDRKKSLCLLSIFGASIIVSHYGLTLIYLFSLIAVCILLLLMENQRVQTLKRAICSKIRKTGNDYQETFNTRTVRPRTITVPYVLFFVIFTIFWYMTFSSGSVIDSVFTIGERIVTSISEEFLNPEAAQGLGMIVQEATSPLHTIYKYFHFVTIFFIVIGLPILILNRKKFRFENEYLVFSGINFLICIAGVTIPFFASALNTTRLYHITLIFLAPFCIIGGLMIFNSILKPFVKGNSYRAISIFFVLFLFFNTGLVDQIATGESGSIALDSTKIESTTDYVVFNDREVSGAQWLSGVYNNHIYADISQNDLWRSFGTKQVGYFPDNSSQIVRYSYIFLGTYNIMEKNIRIVQYEKYPDTSHNSDFPSSIKNKNKIFTNSGAEVYYT